MPAEKCPRLAQAALAVAGGLAIGGAMGWLAAQLEQLRSPWLLFPLATGLALGAALVRWLRWVRADRGPMVFVVTVCAVAAMTVGQHYFSFRAILRANPQNAAALEKARLLFPENSLQSPLPPRSFGLFLRWQAGRGRPIGRFVARGGLAWASWALDGLLSAATAFAVTGFRLRRPAE
jgi:hypothetical protein